LSSLILKPLSIEGANSIPIIFFDTLWSKQDYMTAASMAGFIDIKVEDAVVFPEIAKQLVTTFWSELLDEKLGRTL